MAAGIFEIVFVESPFDLGNQAARILDKKVDQVVDRFIVVDADRFFDGRDVEGRGFEPVGPGLVRIFVFKQVGGRPLFCSPGQGFF